MSAVENRQSETTLEELRLKKTIEIAQGQLKQAQDTIEGKQEEIMEAKREVRENTVHSLTNLYSSDGFEALVELSQCINPVTEIITDCEEEKRKIHRLEALVKNPYFARIDFMFEDEEEAEQVYIGKSSLMDNNTRRMYVYDWRSPIASVFYRFMTGKAYYDAPGGTIDGEVRLKRQYEIKNGKLEYFFDTDRNVNDEFLRQMLSQNTSPKMKAIVETIQKEQDIVIRDMDSDLLMVQGVAGSGKTSIGLHRAAYLLYQGLQTKLSANNILIVSPNATFEQYISDVLPELGEENVASVVFDDVMDGILREQRIQSKNDFLEHAVTNNSYKKVVKNSIELKTSRAFLGILEQLIKEIPVRWIDFQDVSYGGNCVVTKEEMRDWVLKRPETPLGIRLAQLEDYVLEKIFGTAVKGKNAEEQNRIRQQIQNFTRIDVAGIYRKLFYEKDYLEAWEAEMLDDILTYTRENLESGRLYYDDAIAVTYLYLRIYGADQYRNIRQMVIDEAQDYYPLQFEIFRFLFPNAKFTVLGDINQTLGKQENLSLYEQIPNILKRKNASLITLDKSFRCTNEILNFSLQFISHRPEIQSFNRSGDVPKVAGFAARKALLDEIMREINISREKGLKTICLICKTEKNCIRLYEELKPGLGSSVQLIKDRNIENLKGTFIMPVYMSKGLEFDGVIICDADGENYCDEDDKKLLYVECTRALHRLGVMCEGSLSTLITGNVDYKLWERNKCSEKQ